MESEYIARKTKLIEYTKIHLVSLHQDMDEPYNVETKINIQGQIIATRHLLEVMEEML